ncbi:MAG TPA: iron-containing redox enzyme family protein [Fimbriimonas sp.]|nr:iron-containing redox enzyme family protein [Fimbriimonas sp.]
MDRISELNQIIERHGLNSHPFYQEWRMGTLPTEKLTDYAGEYGRFVATIAKGWDTIGMAHYAEEEREHELLWNDFKAELGCTTLSQRPQTEVLVSAADNLFATPAEAVGALYAFEAQQPHTSRSKLDGLNEHYNMSEKAKHYFVVHADDVHEVEDLAEKVNAMSDEEFSRCKTACTIVSAAMWSALDGVYYG